jgi:Amt family ammonium transporter
VEEGAQQPDDGEVEPIEDSPSLKAETVEGPKAPIDAGDTAWMLIATALVMMMTLPGLALFYGGMVRAKNVVGTIMQSVMVLVVVSIVWMVVGYSLAFGNTAGGIIGGLDFLFLNGVGLEPHPTYGSTIPHQLFMVFQMVVAGITPALITGAFAERMKLSSTLVFCVLWSLFVYAPLAHWVWGGGWMADMGVLDFGGGAVVHLSAGASALACAFVLGKRKGQGTAEIVSHDLPMTALGAGLLWVGWFGFNAGGALGANETAVRAFVSTQAAACSGLFAWFAIEWARRGKPSFVGSATGLIAALACITPAAGFVSPMSALAIGALGGALGYLVVNFKHKAGYDDSLDVVGTHGIGGFVGLLAVGVFAIDAANMGKQAMAAIVTLVFSFAVSWVLLRITNVVIGLRVSPEAEDAGLDASLHGEVAYGDVAMLPGRLGRELAPQSAASSAERPKVVDSAPEPKSVAKPKDMGKANRVPLAVALATAKSEEAAASRATPMPIAAKDPAESPGPRKRISTADVTRAMNEAFAINDAGPAPQKGVDPGLESAPILKRTVSDSVKLSNAPEYVLVVGQLSKDKFEVWGSDGTVGTLSYNQLKGYYQPLRDTAAAQKLRRDLIAQHQSKGS